MDKGLRFHSLQTGKPIQRSEGEKSKTAEGNRFRFPSNGKAYPKYRISGSGRWCSWCFNSLQTGKPIQSRKRYSDTPRKACFNSLQTGKPIQRPLPALLEHLGKRKFQFPSNGKAYPKALCLRWWHAVMLRFNSLQTGKPIQRGDTSACKPKHCWFQFPSNGKAYPKTRAHSTTGNHCHGNWFQFPSNGKAYPKEVVASCHFQGLGFNSLQTGKPIQSHSHFIGNDDPETALFQFPSNGKAYPKTNMDRTGTARFLCFNSLQTGKPIQSSLKYTWQGNCKTRFQFPSNGKAYPKLNATRICGKGRKVSIPFKRESLSKVMVPLFGCGIKEVETVSIPFKRESLSKEGTASGTKTMTGSFNSLQTGKPIQRNLSRFRKRFLRTVSIPFKRESLSKE